MRSRRARSFSTASEGWIVVFCSAISHWPGCPRRSAAARAAATCAGDMPSSSASLETSTAPSRVAASTFWRNFVVSVEISAFRARSFALSPSARLAPARTKRVW